MACYYPLKGYRTPGGVVFSELARHDILGDIEIPCGQCIGCRMRRASDWTLRVMHEASLWPDNCFVTLTYGRDKLPADGSLEHRDFQLFMKRVRHAHKGRTVRFYMCGEYGEENGRAHYHACLFNVGFRSDRVQAGKSGSGSIYYTSAALSQLWPHGRSSVQDLTRETAGYCARYIMKKRLGPGAETDAAYVTADGVIRRREYAAMSLKPGIGANWFHKFSSDVYPRDFVVAGGSKLPVPKYYHKLFKRTGNDKLDQIEYERFKRSLLTQADNSDERRRVRDQVHQARVKSLKRSSA